jgi:hypothetical protein
MTTVTADVQHRHDHDHPHDHQHADGGPGYPPEWAGYQVAPPSRFSRLMRFLYVKPSWLAPLALLACFGMSVFYVEKFDPTTGVAGPTGGCAFKALTGLDCPGCGGTRAFWYLLHGNLPEAARNHAVAVFATPFLIYAYIAWTLKRVFNVKIPMLRFTPTTIGVFLGVWGAFAVLRNIPWPPFTQFFV